MLLLLFFFTIIVDRMQPKEEYKRKKNIFFLRIWLLQLALQDIFFSIFVYCLLFRVGPLVFLILVSNVECRVMSSENVTLQSKKRSGAVRRTLSWLTIKCILSLLSYWCAPKLDKNASVQWNCNEINIDNFYYNLSFVVTK